MIIFRDLAEIKGIEKTAVALGNFDGIHKGHQALITRAVDIAREKGIKSAVFTFSNHPRNVLSGENTVKNIIYEDEKIEILEQMGVDYLFTLDFGKLMNQTPEEFVKDMLVDTFCASAAVCGFNFTYGRKAAGTAETLLSEKDRYGIDVYVVDPVTVGGEVVSSTLIREKISTGEVSAVQALLGRPYTMRGEIRHGNEIGRTMGFPTCNIVIDETMVTPTNGVYVTRAHVRGRLYDSVTNVGNKPTVGTYAKNIETNIFDFHEDVYGETMTVEFLEKIRDERKFASLDELKEQISSDKAYAISFHKKSHVRS
jgi:riboflavin kinase / FMN adenylyltransferase